MKQLFKYIMILLVSFILLNAKENIALKHVSEVKVSNVVWLMGSRLLQHRKSIFLVNGYDENIITIVDFKNTQNPFVINNFKVANWRDLNSVSKNNPTDIRDIQVTPDEKYLFVSIYNMVKIYEIKNLKDISYVGMIELKNARDLALSNDGKYLFAYGDTKDFSFQYGIYNIENIKNIQYIASYPKFWDGLISFRDNQYQVYRKFPESVCFTLTDSTDILHPKVLDAVSDICNRRGSFSQTVNMSDFEFSKDNKYLYIAGYLGGIVVYNIEDNKLKFIRQTSGRHWGMLFNCTKAVTNLALYNKGNTLFISTPPYDEDGYLKLSEPEYINCIEGVDKTIAISADRLWLVEDSGLLIALLEEKGTLNIYSIEHGGK
ncbi:MAG TPA: hypothetical protein EYG82_05780 [Sulfurovum sp.]|nr:hypothetical protein [Sulfurovum sp.]